MICYCVKCKKKTDTTDMINKTAKNGRPIMLGKCADCNNKKAKFLSNKK